MRANEGTSFNSINSCVNFQYYYDNNINNNKENGLKTNETHYPLTYSMKILPAHYTQKLVYKRRPNYMKLLLTFTFALQMIS